MSSTSVIRLVNELVGRDTSSQLKFAFQSRAKARRRRESIEWG